MKTIYRNSIFKIIEDEYEGHKIVRLNSPDWVNVLAFNEKNELLLIKQYRHGTKSIILETPGGLIDEKDSSPLEAAKRELEEETGYTSTDWQCIGEVLANPAYQNNKCYFFIAKNIKKTCDQKLDIDERIYEILFSKLSTVKEMLLSGEINHSIVFANISNYFLKKHVFTY
jgi:ADP-ribose pyrophosphatase